MKVTELRNYGCSLDEIVNSVPDDLMKKMRSEYKVEMSNTLGVIGKLRFMLEKRKFDKIISNKEYEIAKELSVNNVNFVKNMLNRAAVFGALSKVIGKEEAVKFNCRIADKTTYDLMESFNPVIENLKACGDPFEAFKQYMRACIETNGNTGIHEYEEVEANNNIYRFNIKACAFHSIPNKLGLGDACLSSCHGDDVFYPRYCKQFGVEFIRKYTIARGDKVCDFCFKRIDSK